MNQQRLERLHTEARQFSEQAQQEGNRLLAAYERGRSDAIRQILEAHRLDQLMTR